MGSMTDDLDHRCLAPNFIPLERLSFDPPLTDLALTLFLI